VSARRGFRFAAPAAFLAAVLAAGCDTRSIDYGKVAEGTWKTIAAARPLNSEEEAEIGGSVAACVASAHGVVEDGRATTYVNLVAQTVSAYNSRPALLPRVMILNADEPNAFACPGGYLFVTRGLLKLCRDESELAGVLSHEVTHVARKHSINRLRWKNTTSCGAAALASAGPQQVQQAYEAMSPLVNAVKDEVVNNKHGTKSEEEADLTGAECAARAGYDGAGLARLVERMTQGAGEKTGWKEFSIYPDGSTRGQKITKRLAELKLDGGGATNAERFKRELSGVVR
jgi:predicted Zn-dependent protease